MTPRSRSSGLPDCASPFHNPLYTAPVNPLQGANPGLNTHAFTRLGIPVPANYSAPSYGALEEDLNIHLQAFRLGEILFTVCSCEQWKDQGTNIKTRTDRVEGNQYNGYDWAAQCTPNGDGTYGADPEGFGTGTWDCPDPRKPGERLGGLSDEKVQRVNAQVNNPANGWNNQENTATAESEPADPRQIKGNFTHDDDARSAELGYRLTVAIGMANDYNGYIASYREYQRGDHYRKALTAWGPHSADYLATRLVTLGRRLKSPDEPLPTDQQQESDPLITGRITADNAFNDQRATAFGTTGAGLIDAYEARLPDDGGKAEPVTQPPDVERFGVALFTWNGGSNFTDSPDVRVQRRVGSAWREYADGTGEVPITIKYPQGPEVPSYESGSFRWEWTAHFEPFVSRFDLGDRPRATPVSRYRFVVKGSRREGRTVVPYTVVSRVFEVNPWSGIAVRDLRAENDGRVSLRIGPRTRREAKGGGGPDIADEIGPIDYPDSYKSPAPFIRDEKEFLRDPDAPADPDKLEWFCVQCSWRPWLDEGDAETVDLTFVGPGGAQRVAAVRRGDRWVSERSLRRGEAAYVGSGCAQDAYGNYNRAPSAVVGRDGVAATAACATQSASLRAPALRHPQGTAGRPADRSRGARTHPGAEPQGLPRLHAAAAHDRSLLLLRSSPPAHRLSVAGVPAAPAAVGAAPRARPRDLHDHLELALPRLRRPPRHPRTAAARQAATGWGSTSGCCAASPGPPWSSRCAPARCARWACSTAA